MDDIKSLVPLAVTFIIAAVVLGFGGLVLSDMGDSFEESASNTTTSQEDLTINQSFYAHLEPYAVDDCAATVSSVLNTTGRVTIESANYTVTNCTLIATSSVSEPYNNTGWSVNYTYTYTDHPKQEAILDNGTDTLSTMGKYLPTMALILIAALIISLVVGAFYFMRL